MVKKNNKPHFHILMDTFVEGLKPEIDTMSNLYRDFIYAHNKQQDNAEELFNKMNEQYDLLTPVLELLVKMGTRSAGCMKLQEKLYAMLESDDEKED